MNLKSKIDKQTLFINICHVTSNNGNEMSVSEVGKIIKTINPNIIYSIDACQSIGHINVRCKKI